MVLMIVLGESREEPGSITTSPLVNILAENLVIQDLIKNVIFLITLKILGFILSLLVS